MLPNPVTNSGIIWTIDGDSSIATISGSSLSGVAPGTVILTATAADGSGVSATQTFTVTAHDLEIASFSVSPISINIDQTLTLSATVQNNGNAAAAATRVRFYRSTSEANLTDDANQISSDAVGGLGISGTQTLTATSAASATAGTFYYGVCVAATANEADTTNNCSAAFEVTVTAADLVASNFSVSSNTVNVGDNITLSATVQNSGDAAAAATMVLFYRFTNETNLFELANEITSEAVGSLAVSATQDITASNTVPAAVGTFYYGVCVAATANESDISNNCSAAFEVTVIASDLVVADFSISSLAVNIEEAITLSVSVKNQGNSAAAATRVKFYRHSTNDFLSGEEITAADIGDLAVSATQTITAASTATATAGIYYYGVCVDAVVNETPTNNNCSAPVSVKVLQWTKAAATHSWPARKDHSTLVFDNKMWILGGFGNIGEIPTAFNSVWSSADGSRIIQSIYADENILASQNLRPSQSK
ncbi:MAG: hypothetical protein HAW58_06950 [Candidatus Thioglobus sp.]|nr:hypothetical protein [Candidatus Thioglobus sp.]